ncbi:MAG: DNA replication/repair protein RecF [Lachnospirales bacterium]
MFVKKLYLNNFRNLQNLDIELSQNVNIFMGDNGQGKTNVLESIYVSSIGKSFRTFSDKELVNFNMDFTFGSVDIYDDNSYDKIDFYIDKIGKKRFSLNKCHIKKNGDLLGNLYTITFTPKDLNIIKLGPSERRNFINTELCQISNIYLNNLKQYNIILKQRNNLLKQIQKNSKLEDQLFMWDSQLIEFGKKIFESRKKFIDSINVYAVDLHNKITDNKESLNIIYKFNVNSDEFEEKLDKSRKKDIFTGSTNVGIHKDDIVFLVDDKDVRVFGSQGQQRTVALAIKLAEIYLIKKIKNKKPVLLLDDILSELDKKRQNFLLEEIDDLQVILTCTGVEDFVNFFKDKENTKIFKVNEGNVIDI